MPELLTNPDQPPISAGSERMALVRRIAASRHFVKALHLQRILIYICEQTLAAGTTAIREHDIGCNVLGRRADFNPHEDNIVRVQLSHLRRKLDDYFAAEGQDEPIRLTIPKGGYAAHFELNHFKPSRLDSPSPVIPEPVEIVRRPRHPLTLTLAGFLVVLFAACFYLVGMRSANQAGPAHAQEFSFLSRIFPAGQPTHIVVADTCLVMLQDILKSDISLPTYLSKDFPQNLIQQTPDVGLRAALSLISSRQYTSLGDLNIASKLIELNSRASKGKASIRYARFLNMRDFKTDNFVLIGSRRGIPWVGLFESQVNFALVEDAATHRFLFRNKSPHAGEQATYEQTIENGSVADTYADVELLPNLGNNGHVLILSGIGMEATEAAGELISSPDFAGILQKTLKQSGQQPVTYFEILLRIRALVGTPGNSQIVAYRVVLPHVS